ncbi:hypothetical protein A2U01_0058353, partial [Trifolium medium]|nr:hypothetical protein [Trifolium medium]
MGLSGDPDMGQKGIQNPNLPRPPNPLLPPPGAMPHAPIHVGTMSQENDLFLDAMDNGSVGSADSDMEV